MDKLQCEVPTDQLLLEMNEKEVGFRTVKGKEIGSYPGGDLLKSILKTSKIGAESEWMKSRVVSIEMMIYERSEMRVLSGVVCTIKKFLNNT